MQGRFLLSLVLLSWIGCSRVSPTSQPAWLLAVDHPRLRVGAGALDNALAFDDPRSQFLVRSPSASFEARVSVHSGALELRRSDARKGLRLKPVAGPIAWQSGTARSRSIVFRADHERAAVVLTPIASGVKEDIVLARSIGDSLVFEWELELDDGLAAYLDSRGDVRVPRAEPKGIATVGAQARANGYRIPAPVVRQASGDLAPGAARFELAGSRLRLLASGLEGLAYPLTIDPSVLVTSTEEFGLGGNDEGGVEISWDQVTRALPGGAFSAFNADARRVLNAPRTDHAAVAYNGYLYVIGGWDGASVRAEVMFSPLSASNPLTWMPATSLPSSPGATGRRNHIGVAYNGYLYVVGGTTGSGSSMIEVLMAPIKRDGTIGAWTKTKPLPSDRTGAAVVATRGFLYVIGGGQTLPNLEDEVLSAPINADGTLGDWVASTSTLPSGRRYHASLAAGGYLYVIGGEGASVVLDEVLWAPINSDGTLGPFEKSPTEKVKRIRHTAIFHRGYLIVAGGYEVTGGQTLSDTLVAPLLGNGAVGPLRKGRELHSSIAGHQMVTDRNNLYIVGGEKDAKPTPSKEVFTAQDEPSTPGEFKLTTPFSTGRTSHALVAYRGFLYVLGGGDKSLNALDDVQFARINNDGSLGSFSPTTKLPSARHSFSAVAHEGYLFINGGGSNSATILNDFHRVPIGPDGKLGATWTSLATSEARAGHSSVIYANHLFLIGGAAAKQVESAFFESATNVKPWNSALPALVEPRTYHATALYGSTLFVLGGRTSNTETNTIERTTLGTDGTLSAWTTEAVRLPSPRYGHAAAAYNGRLYVVGGQNGATLLDNVLVAEIKASGSLGSFATVRNLDAPRVGAQSALLDGTLYVAGGSKAGSPTTDDVLFSSLGTRGRLGTFAQKVSNVAISRAAAAAFDGSLFLFGVKGSPLDASQSKIDPHGVPGAFTRLNRPVSPDDLEGHTVSGYRDLLFLVGGFEKTSTTVSSRARFARIGAGSALAFSAPVATLTTPRVNHSTVIHGNHLYVTGGCIDEACTGIKSSVEHAEIGVGGQLGTFALTSALPSGLLNGGRHSHAAAAHNGYVYAIGGCTAGPPDKCSWSLGDVAVAKIDSGGGLDVFKATTPLPTDRYGHTAFAQDGYLYVVGGCGSKNCATQLNEVIAAPIRSDGSLGSWMPTASLKTARAMHVAMVERGFLYVAGGCTGSPCTASALDFEYAPLLTPAARGFYSRLVDLGASATSLDKLTVNGSAARGTVRAEYRVAPTLGLFGKPKDLGVLELGKSVMLADISVRYALLRFYLDDTQAATVSPDASNARDLSDFTLEYTGGTSSGAAQLGFRGGVDQKLAENACSQRVTIETQNSLGTPVVASAPVEVTLDVNPSTGSPVAFFDDMQCMKSTTMIQIAGPATSGSFYFKGIKAGTYTITASTSRPGIASATTTQTITAGTTAISPPGKPSVTPLLSNDRVVVDWTASTTPGVTHTLERSDINSTTGWLIIGTPAAAPFHDRPPAEGTYTYQVRAWIGLVGSALSPPSEKVIIDKTAPNAPTTVTAKLSDGEGVRVAWSASSDTGGATVGTYELERTDGGGAWVFLAPVPAPSTSYVYQPIAGSYLFRVRAVDTAGNKSRFTESASPVTVEGPLGSDAGLDSGGDAAVVTLADTGMVVVPADASSPGPADVGSSENPAGADGGAPHPSGENRYEVNGWSCSAGAVPFAIPALSLLTAAVLGRRRRRAQRGGTHRC